MKPIRNLSNGCISLALAVSLALAAALTGNAGAEEHETVAHGMFHMQHITTQSQAEALEPGDFISMACAKCKSVMVQKVTTDTAHVKLLTAGQSVMCHACEATVKVVATKKGKGKDTEVKHVCSKCGDDAMFICATKPGSSKGHDGHKK